MSRSYFSNLDLVRFAAALWVVGYHYVFVASYREGVFAAEPSALAANVFRSGYLGVCIFFVLSGFLIAHVSEGARFVRFVTARVCRLMPAFWTCLAITTLVMVLAGASNTQQAEPINLAQGLANAALLPQIFGFEFVDGVYWTLVYEFIFYGWASLLLAAGLLHRNLLGIVAVWLMLSFLNTSILQSSAVERLCITYYSGAFAAGLLMWHIRRHGLAIAPLVLLACSIYALSFGVVEMANQDYVPEIFAGISSGGALMASAFSVSVVAAALLLPASRRLAAPGFVMGSISYPLYLVHQELGYLALRAAEWQGAPIAAAIILCGFMVGIAWAIHQFAERPLRGFMVKLLEPMVQQLEALSSRAATLRPNSKPA